MFHSKIKRILSFTLLLAMLLSVLPTVAFAAEGETIWSPIALSEITADQTIAITMSKDDSIFALPTVGEGSKSQPLVVQVAKRGDNLLTTGDIANFGWTITEVDGSYTIASGENFLYVTADNNGVRIGATQGLWTVTDGYLTSTDTKNATRYLGAYNATDFRCYTSINNNIKGQTLEFWALNVPTEPGVCTHPNMVVDEKAPTCIAGGYKNWTCPDCEESGAETYDYDPEAHQLGRTVTLELDLPTCKDPGRNQVIEYCDLCGGEISNIIVEIPATGIHDFVDGSCSVCELPAPGAELVAAEEINDGDRVVIYSVAGNSVISLNASGTKLASSTDFTLEGDTLISGETTAVLTVYEMGNGIYTFERYDITVLATGEKGNSLYYGNWDETCILWRLVPVEGQPGIFKIVNCNAAYTEGVYDQALEYYKGNFTTYGVAETEAYYFRFYTLTEATDGCDHDLTLISVVKEPTCSEGGIALYCCEICGEEVEEELETVDHTWDEGVSTAPGCTTVGCTTYTCTVCGQERHEYTPATGHSYEVAVTQAPTCTEGGYTTYVCSLCNDSYNETADPALGHIWTEATCTSPSYCERCNAPGGIYFAMESAEELTDGSQIIIVANVDGAYKALDTTVASTMAGIDVTVSDGKVTGDTLPVWTARLTAEGGYALTAGGAYLMHKNSTTFGTTPDVFDWTFENTENGIKIYSGTRGIIYRTDANGFRAYATSNIGKNTYYGELLLFKYVEGATLDHADNDQDNCCDFCGIPMTEEAEDAVLTNRSISLNGNIGINFYMTLSEKVLADETAYMLFTQEGKEPTKVYIADAALKKVRGEDAYVFTYEVAAKEMTDTITAQFFYGDTATEEYTYSVKTYADNQRENLADNEALMNLLDAMLRYGAASQRWFGYHTDRPADEGMEPVDYAETSIDFATPVRPRGTQKVSYAGTSLLLNSNTTLRFFFTTELSPEDFTVTYEGETLAVTARDGRYYVDIDNIAAQNLDMEFTITLNDGTETAEITYSPLSYCVSVKNNIYGAYNDTMLNVVTALYLYNCAANAYFTPAE